MRRIQEKIFFTKFYKRYEFFYLFYFYFWWHVNIYTAEYFYVLQIISLPKMRFSTVVPFTTTRFLSQTSSINHHIRRPTATTTFLFLSFSCYDVFSVPLFRSSFIHLPFATHSCASKFCLHATELITVNKIGKKKKKQDNYVTKVEIILSQWY